MHTALWFITRALMLLCIEIWLNICQWNQKHTSHPAYLYTSSVDWPTRWKRANVCWVHCSQFVPQQYLCSYKYYINLHEYYTILSLIHLWTAKDDWSLSKYTWLNYRYDFVLNQDNWWYFTAPRSIILKRSLKWSVL